jgi:tetrahydromethanopterin S-methyltransferase subunit C
MEQLKALVDRWVVLAQGIIGSIGGLAFANVKSPCTRAQNGAGALQDVAAQAETLRCMCAAAGGPRPIEGAAVAL